MFLLNSDFFFILLPSRNSIHIPHSLPQNRSLLFAVVTKWALLSLPFKANSCRCALNCCLYNTQFLSIKHLVLLYTTLNSSLYNTQFFSIQHSIPVYKTPSSSIYNTQFFSIQRSIPVYKTPSSSIYNTQFLYIQHPALLYTTLNSRTLSQYNQKGFHVNF